jgi:hypothetical protein
MTSPQAATTVAPSLGRDVVTATRHYLGKRWVLLALSGGLVIGLGLYFGGWGWLVTVGAAPVILSILPCLIMCGLGMCMACRSANKESATASAVETASSASALIATKVPLGAGLSCCQADVGKNPAILSKADLATQEKEKSDA